MKRDRYYLAGSWEDKLAPARGLVVGLGLSLLFWIVLGLLAKIFWSLLLLGWNLL